MTPRPKSRPPLPSQRQFHNNERSLHRKEENAPHDSRIFWFCTQFRWSLGRSRVQIFEHEIGQNRGPSQSWFCSFVLFVTKWKLFANVSYRMLIWQVTWSKIEILHMTSFFTLQQENMDDQATLMWGTNPNGSLYAWIQMLCYVAFFIHGSEYCDIS